MNKFLFQSLEDMRGNILLHASTPVPSNPAISLRPLKLRSPKWSRCMITRMKTTSRPAAKSKVAKPTRAKPTRDVIVRAVASSTAVETGQPIGKIERALRARCGKFSGLQLAR